MISVTVYGRNDTHGYNLHKRVAISLNCIAEMLTDRDDEIIFVDYNTPDDSPTFPEAIGDTLTGRAKALLRVLRVRPRLHARYAARTHLSALEPIARNTALRRSNPANRWLLSTNTDMMFVPKQPGSLSTLAETLEDGFYHLPRFGLPESVWESFSRSDPAGILATVADHARRLHLNEVVHGSDDILYDAPGDFQLGLRADLIDNHGFNESMLAGWHLDSNLARRMGLLRGGIRSAADLLAGYHCDHTRQATLMHRRVRVEDDWDTYVRNVSEPAIPEQRDSWGLAGEEIEEFKLANSPTARFSAAIEQTVGAPQVEAYAAHYNSQGYHDLRYSAEHALPYVMGLLSARAPAVRIAYAGARPDTFDLISRATALLLPEARFAVPLQCEWLGDDEGSAGAALQRLSDEEWERWADLYIFEVGMPLDADGVVADAFLSRSASIVSRFWRFGAGEAVRRRPYVLAINAVNNHFEGAVETLLNCTRTPYGARVRHGFPDFILPEPRSGEKPAVGEWIASRTSRVFAPSPVEIMQLRQLCRTLFSDGAAAEAAWWTARCVAEPLIALLAHPAASDLLGASQAEVDALQSRLESGRPGRAVAATMWPLTTRAGAKTASTRLAEAEDWEDAGFSTLAARLFGARSYSVLERSVALWDLVSHLRIASEHVPAKAERMRVLIVNVVAEPLGSALAEDGADVRFASPERLLAASDHDVLGEPKAGAFGTAAALSRDELTQGPQFDLVLFPSFSLFSLGRHQVATLLDIADKLLRPAGRLVFTTPVRLDEGTDVEALPRSDLLPGGFIDRFAAATGYLLDGEADFAQSPSTLDRVSALGLRGPAFVDVRPGGFGTVALWTWRKDEGARIVADDVRSMVNFGSEPLGEFGGSPDLLLIGQGESADITALARAQPMVAWADGTWVIDKQAQATHALYGPYLRIPAGRYWLEMETTLEIDADDGASVAEDAVVMGIEIVYTNNLFLLSRTFARRELDGGRVGTDLSIMPGHLGQLVEIRVNHAQVGRLRVRGMRLTRHAHG
jgi:hypothetical protein